MTSNEYLRSLHKYKKKCSIITQSVITFCLMALYSNRSGAIKLMMFVVYYIVCSWVCFTYYSGKIIPVFVYHDPQHGIIVTYNLSLLNMYLPSFFICCYTFCYTIVYNIMATIFNSSLNAKEVNPMQNLDVPFTCNVSFIFYYSAVPVTWITKTLIESCNGFPITVLFTFTLFYRKGEII